jgi:hypothetical protein
MDFLSKIFSGNSSQSNTQPQNVNSSTTIPLQTNSPVSRSSISRFRSRNSYNMTGGGKKGRNRRAKTRKYRSKKH